MWLLSLLYYAPGFIDSYLQKDNSVYQVMVKCQKLEVLASTDSLEMPSPSLANKINKQS